MRYNRPRLMMTNSSKPTHSTTSSQLEDCQDILMRSIPSFTKPSPTTNSSNTCSIKPPTRPHPHPQELEEQQQQQPHRPQEERHHHPTQLVLLPLVVGMGTLRKQTLLDRTKILMFFLLLFIVD
ncbi:hypothetical protein K457DRAFT_493158 [Linnemannia elongata AG-77]|uniref:Uncharacterized protein n=1 Tax=Linnemannia elongata AG-77 TaxID=1314771 RepID=A0A197KE02_9FUNG|nr:hypothetical protein K457DRAFT_493158 [Linnemannia elongata AG-77]